MRSNWRCGGCSIVEQWLDTIAISRLNNYLEGISSYEQLHSTHRTEKQFQLLKLQFGKEKNASCHLQCNDDIYINVIYAFHGNYNVINYYAKTYVPERFACNFLASLQFNIP